ncbi:protoporphyrin/coproporphyrin ferrochelatase [Flavobacteriales bacterium]|nr:protoporphyrin/coproporphyrin ferrochelatase [Flavobacteriales bacterium]
MLPLNVHCICSMNEKTAILLVNLGTPDSPSVSDVRKYLSEFLNDPRVIDIAWLPRKLLVNGIIVPFRSPKSARIYKQLWTSNGSPLLYYSLRVKELLQQRFLNQNVVVELAMRYQHPSISSVLQKMKKEGYAKIIVFPMFPQYASSTTGTAFQKIMEEIGKWWVIPSLHFVAQYYHNETFIKAFAEQGKKYLLEEFEHILFSFHGLPLRHLNKNYEDGKPCSEHNCDIEVNENNAFCYKATCYETARLIAFYLNIPKEKYSVAFQSRLGKDPWIEPYADQLIAEKAKQGIKKMLVFSPAFTADCLETNIEIGVEYKEIFIQHGGTSFQLVESLNDSPLWIDAIEKMVRKFL